MATVFGETFIDEAFAASLSATGLYLSLHTASLRSQQEPTGSSSSSAPPVPIWEENEVMAPDYARVFIPFADLFIEDGAIAVASSALPVVFTSAAASPWGTIRSLGAWKSATSILEPDLVWAADIAPYVVGTGDRAEFNPVDIRITRFNIFGVQPPGPSLFSGSSS